MYLNHSEKPCKLQISILLHLLFLCRFMYAFRTRFFLFCPSLEIATNKAYLAFVALYPMFTLLVEQICVII